LAIGAHADTSTVRCCILHTGLPCVIRLIAIRIAWFASIILAVSLIVFTVIHLSGDPTDGFVEPGASPETIAAIRSKWGLDDSLPRQYLQFVGHAVQGDFGESWRARTPAMRMVLERMPATLELTAMAVLLALIFGLAIGLLTARSRSPLGRMAGLGAMALGQAIPSFWLGAMLVIVFAVRLQWLPSSGRSDWTGLILPALTLALQPAAMIARLVFGQVSETLDADFIRTARSKGLDERTVVLRHALRPSLGPLLAFIGVQIGFLLGGAVVVEGVFAWPGVGLLALNAVQDRDLPVIQAFVVTLAVLIVSLTMIVDLLARTVDPRIRMGAAK